MLTWIPFYLLLLMLAGCAGASVVDHRRRRPPAPDVKLSFLVPCYNDGGTLQATLESLYASHAPSCMEVLVADDASTDGSVTVLNDLARRYPLRVFRNPRNLGKAETLNRLTSHARHDILIFVDADTLLHPRAVADLTARLASNPRLGAVSCPYQPLNKGWLPSLQAIDYSMIMLVQGAYNVFSGLALWGGCLAVRRAAFEQAGRFSVSAITEDVDLAHKLNRAGWRVQQSMVPVRSWVPGTLRAWIRQKMRWTAGGFQCLYKHPAVWMRNPLHVVLMAVYSFLSLHCLYALAQQTVALKGLFDLLAVMRDFLPWHTVLPIMAMLFSHNMAKELALSVGFGLLTGIYVIPLIAQWRDATKLLLVVPFTLGYFPLYILVSFLGFGYFLLHARRLRVQEARAW